VYVYMLPLCSHLSLCAVQAGDRTLEPAPQSASDLLSSRLTNKFRNVNTQEEDSEAPMSLEFNPLGGLGAGASLAEAKVRRSSQRPVPTLTGQPCEEGGVRPALRRDSRHQGVGHGFLWGGRDARDVGHTLSFWTVGGSPPHSTPPSPSRLLCWVRCVPILLDCCLVPSSTLRHICMCVWRKLVGDARSPTCSH
jgi:hypothetical protein